MMVQPFLRELRRLLTPASAWHPLACANREGFILGEFQQSAPNSEGEFDRATWDVPVAWNLPCAVTYLLNAWDHQGGFVEPIVDKAVLRQAVLGLLAREARVADLWLITEHEKALAAIDGVLRGLPQVRSAA